jgi:hypothetical protein
MKQQVSLICNCLKKKQASSICNCTVRRDNVKAKTLLPGVATRCSSFKILNERQQRLVATFLCKMFSCSTINATGCKVDNKWCIYHFVHIKIKIYKFTSYLYARGKKIKRCAC